MSAVYFKKLSFDGWKTTLHYETLSLLSLLKFRRTKDDFTYSSRDEHFAISKFLEEIGNSSTDQRWAVAAKNTSVKYQAQTEAVKIFWREIELETAELGRRYSKALLEHKEIEIKLSKAEFVLDHSAAGNEAHKLLNNQKLNYMADLSSDGSAGKQKRSREIKPPSTPPNKIRIINTESPPPQYDDFSNDDVTPSPLDAILSVAPKDLKDGDGEAQPPDNKSKGRKYINHDLADEVLKSYQVHILPGHKLIYDNVDVMEFAHSTMKITKKSQLSKSPLSIGIIDIHNVECLRYLPQGFKKYMADQVQNTDVDAVYFSEGKYIDKFLVDCEEEVLKYLENFDYIDNLKSLEECLDKNRINHSTSSNDLIYVENLFLHFLLLYQNDVLTQPLTETEFNAYIWTPMLRNAFLGKVDLRLKCGEVASRSYNQLKEILNVVTRGGPRLDGKGFLKSLGTEILAQEDGAISTHSKRTGDLQKLEYCSKVILTTLFFALPSHVKNRIKDLEVYSLQSNEFQLKISTSKFLFEDTIVTMELIRVEIPRTVECFSKLVVGVKAILSWKARTRKNTMMFYDILREGHKRLSGNGVHFSPTKVPI
ncbi:hypothetical protein RclHR1_29370002 [Rhizophagus clarus]|uniref:Uncharacterized protein n=1 Tax=Rhizophagus clarus TaxID=94130 RepID=A0A2Z6RGP1_9GLOM|nr:hypothetical protein RclHR1_29370002 [Rhizophagus clarus]